MKNFQRTLSMFVFALLLTGVFTLGGCEKTEMTDLVTSGNSKTLSALEQQVFDLNPAYISELQWLKAKNYLSDENYIDNLQSISERKKSPDDMLGEVYTAGDTMYQRSFVQQEMQKYGSGNKQARHRRFNYMDNASSRTVRVQSDVPSTWKTAISSAIAEWNALGYNISFGEVSASNNTNIIGQIDVVYYTYDLLAIPYADRNKVFASTLYPTANGNVGEVLGINKTLDINTSYNANTSSARKSIIAHELGHALGLSHTDTMDYLAVSSATGCSGSATDANSIMRKIMVRNETWKAFTQCDKDVINYYWGNIA